MGLLGAPFPLAYAAMHEGNAMRVLRVVYLKAGLGMRGATSANPSRAVKADISSL